jgi:hypothetical protein
MHNMNNVSTNLLIDCQLDNEVENNFINDEDEAVVVAECVICLDPIIPFSGYRFDCFHQYFQYNYDVENNYICCPICRQQIQIDILPERWKCTEKKWFVFKFIGALSISSFSVCVIMMIHNNVY